MFNINIFNNLIFCFPQGDLAKGFVAGLKKPATLEGEDNDSGTEWEYQVECMIAFNLNKIIKEIPANLMKRKLYCDLIMKMADDHSKEYNDSNSLY